MTSSDNTTGPTLPIRRLGATAITVPAIGIGCWPIGGPDDNLGMPMGWSTGADPAQSRAGLETAWRLGARLYDTADVYGHGRSERLIGELVTQVPRAEIVLASKVGYFAGATADVVAVHAIRHPDASHLQAGCRTVPYDAVEQVRMFSEVIAHP